MLLNVDCLPTAVGKQLSIPLISLGRKKTFKLLMTMIIVIMMACYLSTPFLIFPILKGASRVIFTNFLSDHPIDPTSSTRCKAQSHYNQ